MPLRYYARERSAPAPYSTDSETLNAMEKFLESTEPLTEGPAPTPAKVTALARGVKKKMGEVERRWTFGPPETAAKYESVLGGWRQLHRTMTELEEAAGNRDRKAMGELTKGLHANVQQLHAVILAAKERTPEAQMEKTIHAALEAEIPAIVTQFVEHMRGQFERLFAAYGDNWLSIIRGNHGPYEQLRAQTVLQVCHYRGRYEAVGFDPDEAHRMGLESALNITQQMAHKMAHKLGALTNVQITMLRPGARELTLTGLRGTDTVLVNQQRVDHWNQYGTHYAQFPALIYVNGKKVSEAEYKRANTP